MKKTISFIKTKIITPILSFIGLYAFLVLFLLPFRYNKHKKIDDFDTSKIENVGWITLDPEFLEQNKLPKDFSSKTYDRRWSHHNGELFIQIRKK
jgi:hypothetical protein